MSRSPKLVVGTAGHIDHGKSSLVLALTGVNPDRLPEEQARGMTIDLGFAHTRIDEADIWFVDVPGHERFIRNMVAGATGVDVALLVVAADDAVMPQTREHAELLSLLGVERCVVVVTKIDLVDEEWAGAVEMEARELLRSVGVEPVGAARVSSVTGRGLDDVRAQLAQLARRRDEHAGGYAWFRLPIDRAFNIAGRGVVVTGSVAHGALQRDETLELWPGARRVRARELHTHHEAADSAIGRMRLAVNLVGVELAEVSRGCEIATPGFLEPTSRMDVWLPTLRMPGKQHRRNLRARLHMATSETLVELRLLDTDESIAGVFAQARLVDELVAAWGQRFIIRDEAGQRTLGGGRVLRPVATAWSAKQPPVTDELVQLRDAAPKGRLLIAIRDTGWASIDDSRLATRAGLPDIATQRALRKELIAEGKVVDLGDGAILTTRDRIAQLVESLETRLKTQQSANTRWPGAPRGEWVNWMPRACPEKQRAALGDWLLSRGHFRVVNGYVLPAGGQEALSDADQKLLGTILAEFRDAGFQPPAPNALTCISLRNQKRVAELVQLAVARGQLMRVDADILVHDENWRAGVTSIVEALRQRDSLAVADIRALLNSSRKYVVPILEKLDALGITKRVGDKRSLGPKSGE